MGPYANNSCHAASRFGASFLALTQGNVKLGHILEPPATAGHAALGGLLDAQPLREVWNIRVPLAGLPP